MFKTLHLLKKRFDLLGWVHAPGSYAVTINIDPSSNEKEHRISLLSEKPGEVIKYTTNGSEPTRNSLAYHNPIKIKYALKLILSITAPEIKAAVIIAKVP